MGKAAQYAVDYHNPLNTGINKTRAKNRHRRACKAAAASAKARRKRAKGRKVPHARTRKDALVLAYKVIQVNLKTFRVIEAERRRERGVQPSERGTMTLWAEYQSCMRAYRAQGNFFGTTNAQRARALALRGRPRCERTIRRAHKELHAMGLLTRTHIRRSAFRKPGFQRPGRRDYLRVQVQSFVPLPSAAAASGLKPDDAAASRPLAVIDTATGQAGGRDSCPAAQPPGWLAPPGTAGGPSPPAKLAGERQAAEEPEGTSRRPALEQTPPERAGPTSAPDNLQVGSGVHENLVLAEDDVLGPPTAEDAEITRRLAAGESVREIMRSLRSNDRPEGLDTSAGSG